MKRNKMHLELEGLCCVNCASKIETEVNKLKDVKEASLNFANRILQVGLVTPEAELRVFKEVEHIVNRIEPGVIVSEVAEKGHSHNHGHEEHHEHAHGNKLELAIMGFGALLFLVGLLLNLTKTQELILFLVAYILVGGEVLLRSAVNIRNGQVFDENFLMSVATIGAFAIGEFPEGVAVMLFYQVGELFQEFAVNKSRKSISALMDIRPDYANLRKGDEVVKVAPEEVKIGDWILIQPGEKVPLDGVVREGKSMLDTSALTGEAVPRSVSIGDGILSGSINKGGVLFVEVEKTFGESTVSKILDLVENAGSRKAPTEKFITKFAAIYTPIVVFLALGLAFIPPLLTPGATWDTFGSWIYRALVFLVVSCPCALVISIPLGFFGGIGAASSHGVLIKGANFLEALNQVETVVFDKTGTLTKGVFRVTKVVEKGNRTSAEILRIAAYAEAYSTHPIGTSIRKAFGEEIMKDHIRDYEDIPGEGIRVTVGEEAVTIGNARLMKTAETENFHLEEMFELENEIGTIVHMAINEKYAGYLVISDEIKEDSARAVKELKQLGIKNVIMITGDRKEAGEKIGGILGVDEVLAERMPDEKVAEIERIEKGERKGKLIFVGDGINDAPVLARADIGIAMGGVGSDAAIEAADIVLMTDEPHKVVTALKVAKRTRKIVMQNIFFAFGVKIIVLAMGAGGLATMWEAVFADVGVAVLAILNSMRVNQGKLL